MTNPKLLLLISILSLAAENTMAHDTDYYAIQHELDAACSHARQQELAPMRQEYVEECIEKSWRDTEQCERFYSDYGTRTGNRAPLFYDLPECVEAFEFRKSYRRVY
jgi:predicted HD phosphohydrolase